MSGKIFRVSEICIWQTDRRTTRTITIVSPTLWSATFSSIFRVYFFQKFTYTYILCYVIALLFLKTGCMKNFSKKYTDRLFNVILWWMRIVFNAWHSKSNENHQLIRPSIYSQPCEKLKIKSFFFRCKLFEFLRRQMVNDKWRGLFIATHSSFSEYTRSFLQWTPNEDNLRPTRLLTHKASFAGKFAR